MNANEIATERAELQQAKDEFIRKQAQYEALTLKPTLMMQQAEIEAHYLAQNKLRRWINYNARVINAWQAEIEAAEAATGPTSPAAA